MHQFRIESTHIISKEGFHPQSFFCFWIIILILSICMYVCMYVCMYIYIIYIHTYINIYTQNLNNNMFIYYINSFRTEIY